MDPISSFILTKIAEAIIKSLTEKGAQGLIAKLQGNATKKALKKALGEALLRYSASHIDRKILAMPLLRTDSILTQQDITTELAQVVRFARDPDVAFIGKRWRNDLEDPPSWRNFTDEAALLITYFRDELKATPTFASVFQLKTLDAIALHGETAEDALESVERELELLRTLLESQYGRLAGVIAGAFTGIQEQIRDFSLYISEKTEEFTGREFIFSEIQQFIDSNSRGYFLLYGDPGIGKSALAARLIKAQGYIHHFNIRAEGINSAGDFLRNVCAQLIAAYDLNYTSLPAEATRDSGFLNRLLAEISEKIRGHAKCVIVVDALDEAEQPSQEVGTNVLLLPRVLPPAIFIVATARREKEERVPLRIDIPEQIERHLRQDEPGNKADIIDYLNFKLNSPGIKSFIKRQKIAPKVFLDEMVSKAQGNFIYLYYVLPQIETGYYKNLALNQIPAGLKNYYENHWRRIKSENGLDWFDYRLPVILALTVMKKPVSINLLMKYANVSDRRRVKEVLHDFDQFIYRVELEFDLEVTICYRWYHASFFDFIGKKDGVREELVDLRSASNSVTNIMWSNLVDEEGSL